MKINSMLNKSDKYKQPIIIIGMHRSGTTMVNTMLEKLGLFVGVNNEKNNESLFFLRYNHWLLKQSGGVWFNPCSIDYLLSNKKVLNLTVNYLYEILSNYKIISYLGFKKYISNSNLWKQTKPWGWKAPCNTFTLPIWLELFPDAKIIWVYRHGVDVAKSLKIRADKSIFKSSSQIKKRKFIYKFFTKKSGFTQAINCHSYQGGLELWSSYMERAEQHSLMLGNRCLSIKYEDILMNPEIILPKLISFCELENNDNLIKDVCKYVDASRAYAYKENDDLIRFAMKNEGKLKKYGY